MGIRDRCTLLEGGQARKKKSTTHKIQSLNTKLQQHTSTYQIVSGRPELYCMFFFSKAFLLFEGHISVLPE